MRPVVLVVPHTHWDREWYQPFETFRMMLVRTVDRAIDLCERDPDYRHFMLDGQSIVLEDYLAIRPGRRERLRALIASGRLAVGPWYVLPDVFLVSGESLVRNLEIGMETARAMGGTMTIGYLPDSFGHVAQMPQLLAGFGMDAASLWRGAPEETSTCEWLWEALDGTRVYVQWLTGGYGNLANLPRGDAAAARFDAERERLAPLARSGVLVMMNGSDHLAPQPHLPALLADWRARHPALEIHHATLSEAIALSRARVDPAALPVVRGELRCAAHSHLLPGVLSTRVPQKLANARCQTLLERWAEPLCALAALEGREHPTAFLAHAWRTLLENHPHDSICGCSVDEVHREMATRFDRVAQVGEQLVHESLAALSGEDPEADVPRQRGLRLENPHPWPQRAAIETELVLDCDPGGDPAFTLTDDEGRPVPATVLGATRGVRVVNRSPGYPLNVPTVRLRVGLVADLPPLGFCTLALTRMPPAPGAPVPAPDSIEAPEWSVRALPGAPVPAPDATEAPEWAPPGAPVPAPDAIGAPEWSVRALPGAPVPAPDAVEAPEWSVRALPGAPVPAPDAIETPEWSVRALPGALEITDRLSGDVVRHTLEDVADRGDEYDFCAVDGDRPVSSSGQAWSSVTTRAWGAGLELIARGSLRVPLELAADRASRTGAADVPVELSARLFPGVRRVDLTVTLDNPARDHRLRAAFRLPEPITATRADTAFGLVERPARAAARAYPEPPVSAQPMVSHVSVAREHGRCGIAAAGLHEYEAEGATLAITLLRCVGWLSRDDLASRRGDAGPMLATPGAQCPGPFCATYSWVFASEDLFARRAAEAAVPARAFPLAHLTVPTRRARIELDQPAWQLSSLRRAPDGTLELRLFSTSPRLTEGRILFAGVPRPAAACRARLDGTPLTALALRDGTARLKLRAFEVATIRFTC